MSEIQDNEGEVIDSLCDEIVLMCDKIYNIEKCREFDLALTKLEEAGMWLQQGKHRQS